MHTVTNTYILHLAVADECFLVGIPFLIATMTMRQWPFGMTMCKIYFTTTSINQITSSLFLMVLSADRYVAVCHPISSPRFRTGIIAKIVSLSVWLISGNTPFIFSRDSDLRNSSVSPFVSLSSSCQNSSISPLCLSLCLLAISLVYVRPSGLAPSLSSSC